MFPEMCILAAIKEGNMSRRDLWTEGYSVGVVTCFVVVNAVWIIVTLVL